MLVPLNTPLPRLPRELEFVLEGLKDLLTVNHPVRCFSVSFGLGNTVPAGLIELERFRFRKPGSFPPGSVDGLFVSVAVVVADVSLRVDAGVRRSISGSFSGSEP